MKPLEGITILDFSQFLSAPSATLRLADFGARVIKVERPDGGDICRTLYVSNLIIENDSSLFHSINRNKYGVSIDLKNPASRGYTMVIDWEGRCHGREFPSRSGGKAGTGLRFCKAALSVHDLW